MKNRLLMGIFGSLMFFLLAGCAHSAPTQEREAASSISNESDSIYGEVAPRVDFLVVMVYKCNRRDHNFLGVLLVSAATGPKFTPAEVFENSANARQRLYQIKKAAEGGAFSLVAEKHPDCQNI